MFGWLPVTVFILTIVVVGGVWATFPNHEQKQSVQRVNKLENGRIFEPEIQSTNSAFNPAKEAPRTKPTPTDGITSYSSPQRPTPVKKADQLVDPGLGPPLGSSSSKPIERRQSTPQRTPQSHSRKQLTSRSSKTSTPSSPQKMSASISMLPPTPEISTTKEPPLAFAGTMVEQSFRMSSQTLVSSNNDENDGNGDALCKEYAEVMNSMKKSLSAQLTAVVQEHHQAELHGLNMRRQQAQGRLEAALHEFAIDRIEACLHGAKHIGIADERLFGRAEQILQAANQLQQILPQALSENDVDILRQLVHYEVLQRLANNRNPQIQQLYNQAQEAIHKHEAMQKQQAAMTAQTTTTIASVTDNTRSNNTQQMAAVPTDGNVPAYVNETRQLYNHLQEWQHRAAQGNASQYPAITAIIEECCVEIRKIASTGTNVTQFDVAETTTKVKRVLHEAKHVGADNLLYCVLQVFTAILEAAASVTTLNQAIHADGMKLFAYLSYVVSDVCGTVKDGPKVFRAMCQCACIACVPMTQAHAAICQQSTAAVPTLDVCAGIALMAAAINHSGYQAFSVDDGWRWLIRYCTLVQTSPTQVDKPAEAISIFLQYCWKAMYQRHGAHFVKAVQEISTTIVPTLSGTTASHLQSLTKQFLQSNALPDTGTDSVPEPYGLIAATMIQSSRHAEDIAKSITAREHKRMVENPVRTAGNILTWEKLGLSLNKVLTMMQEVLRQNDQRLLDYARYFVANVVASRSENDQYTAEAAPLLAAFISGLCQHLPDISDLVRGRLYDMCPETIPQFWQADNVALFLHKLKQLRPSVYDKFAQGDAVTVESYSSYMKIVEQYMWTFAALCVTTHQSPFTVEDAWHWLARVVNRTTTYIPFHLAGVLQPFLKVAGDRLMGVYQQPFRHVLQIVSRDVVPRLDETNDLNKTNKIQLQAVLNNYSR